MTSTATIDPKQACIDYFASLCPLSDFTEDHLNEKLKVHELAKDSRILTDGQIVHEIYYIQRGVARNYYYDEKGDETTGWFAAETEMIYFPSSHRLKIPLSGNVYLTERSVLVSMAYDDLNALYGLDPTANILGKRLSENQMLYFIKRESLFRSKPSSKRYTKFLELFPNLDGRVQNQHVATYLEISPGTVSRVLGSKDGDQKNS